MRGPARRPAGRWARLGPVLVVTLLGLGAAAAAQLVAELAAPPGVTGHHDLLAFWAAGRLILDGRAADLYDAAALTALQRTVIPVPIGMNGYMPYINPPFAAAAFAPLAALSEPVARAVWALLNVALAGGAAAWLTRGLPIRERLLGALLIVTCYPVYHALAEGQWSILLLAAGIVAITAARQGRWGFAGLALAVFWIKPQFVVLPLLALVLGRRWRAVAMTVATGLAAVLVALPLTGVQANATYVAYLLDVVMSHFSGAGAGTSAVWQGDLASTEGINGLLVGWFGQGSVGFVNILWAILVIVLGVVYAAGARRVRPGFGTLPARAMLAGGIAVVLLINPNQFVQDCVLFLLVVEALAPLPGQWRLSAIVVVVAISDLTFVDLQAPMLHFFPIALILGVLWITRWTGAAPPVLPADSPPTIATDGSTS